MNPERTAPSGEEQGQSVSLLQILTVLFRRKGSIAKWTIGFTVVLVLIALLLPKKYTATATFLPPQQGSTGGSALLAQLGSLGALAGLSGGGSSLKSPNDLYVALMKSETVENFMLERYHLMDEYHEKSQAIARKRFEDNAKVEAGAKDGLIHVSVTDRNAARAAELANGYIEQYRRLSSGLAISEASQRRMFFQQQLNDAKEALSKSEEALKQTQQSTGVVQMDSQARALIESAGSLRAQIVAKEIQLSSMRTYEGAGNVDLQQAEQELASMRAQLAKLTGNGSGATTDDGMIVSKGEIPTVGLEYVRRTRDVKYNETLFEILARQFEAAKLDEAKEGALIQVVDPALVPERKSSPHLTYFLLGGLVLGFLGSCCWVLAQAAYEYLNGIPVYAAQIAELRGAMFHGRR